MVIEAVQVRSFENYKKNAPVDQMKAFNGTKLVQMTARKRSKEAYCRAINQICGRKKSVFEFCLKMIDLQLCLSTV